jgi:hypothetical protein
MELSAERDLLTEWTDSKSPGELDTYRAEKNAASIDGLPALS